MTYIVPFNEKLIKISNKDAGSNISGRSRVLLDFLDQSINESINPVSIELENRIKTAIGYERGSLQNAREAVTFLRNCQFHLSVSAYYMVKIYHNKIQSFVATLNRTRFTPTGFYHSGGDEIVNTILHQHYTVLSDEFAMKKEILNRLFTFALSSEAISDMQPSLTESIIATIIKWTEKYIRDYHRKSQEWSHPNLTNWRIDIRNFVRFLEASDYRDVLEKVNDENDNAEKSSTNQTNIATATNSLQETLAILKKNIALRLYNKIVKRSIVGTRNHFLEHSDFESSNIDYTLLKLFDYIFKQFTTLAVRTALLTSLNVTIPEITTSIATSPAQISHRHDLLIKLSDYIFTNEMGSSSIVNCCIYKTVSEQEIKAMFRLYRKVVQHLQFVASWKKLTELARFIIYITGAIELNIFSEMMENVKNEVSTMVNNDVRLQHLANQPTFASPPNFLNFKSKGFDLLNFFNLRQENLDVSILQQITKGTEIELQNLFSICTNLQILHVTTRPLYNPQALDHLRPFLRII